MKPAKPNPLPPRPWRVSATEDEFHTFSPHFTALRELLAK